VLSRTEQAGAVGTETVARAPPDRRTLGVGAGLLAGAGGGAGGVAPQARLRPPRVAPALECRHLDPP
jgi:hypothetical protein